VSTGAPSGAGLRGEDGGRDARIVRLRDHRPDRGDRPLHRPDGGRSARWRCRAPASRPSPAAPRGCNIPLSVRDSFEAVILARDRQRAMLVCDAGAYCALDRDRDGVIVALETAAVLELVDSDGRGLDSFPGEPKAPEGFGFFAFQAGSNVVTYEPSAPIELRAPDQSLIAVLIEGDSGRSLGVVCFRCRLAAAMSRRLIYGRCRANGQGPWSGYSTQPVERFCTGLRPIRGMSQSAQLPGTPMNGISACCGPGQRCRSRPFCAAGAG
jgi:hypothetical protein